MRQSARAFKRSLNPRTKAWGPTLTGLAVVPLLPYLYDGPVEMATEAAFEWLEEKWFAHRAERREKAKSTEL